jgi:biofilm PGA synthesis N-glycosyltransferase PgaC
MKIEDDMNRGQHKLSYILITPARNEETFIEQTIQSVIAQTVHPLKWVIVNDGSTDSTADIVRKYLGQHDWMALVDMPAHRDRSFAAKAHCFNAGYAHVEHLEYDVVGNLDADITFDERYLEFLMERMADDPRLGVAGTVFEENGYSTATNSFEGQNHVAGGCQLFRRRCFEEIGGYVPNKAGGVDWIAVTTARMKGWKTRSFREKAFFHHRSLGTAERGRFAAAFSYGEKDYYLGGGLLWELFRVAYQMTNRPYLLVGLCLGSGYASAFVRRIKRPVSAELMKFHRREQLVKLRAILGSVLRLRRVDNFQVVSH